MTDTSVVDPKIAEAIIANAGAFIEARERVESIMQDAHQKEAVYEDAMTKQIISGVTDETALDEYVTKCTKLRATTDQLLNALKEEYAAKYPPAE